MKWVNEVSCRCRGGLDVFEVGGVDVFGHTLVFV
jgi:hypothetical protein